MSCKLYLRYSLIAQIALMNTSLSAGTPRIHYQLGMSKPHTHLFEVEITLSELDGADEYLDFVVPAWRPGRYVILDFAGGVQEFSASTQSQAGSNSVLAWSKIDKNTWRINSAGKKNVRVSYKVYANEFNLRTRGLNDQHAFLDGSAAFMYVEKYRKLPLTLQVQPFGDWRVSTGLDRVSGKKNFFSAPGYDDFVDCPLEIGTHQEIEFEVQGKPHFLSIFGEGNWDTNKLIERLHKVVQANFEFWGDLPYRHYYFLVHSTPSSGGGTEHLNSTIMGIRPFGFGVERAYDDFTNLAMHEFFHTWNVKQLRPAGIHPYDYTQENYSRLLWVSEGTTTYYTLMLMRRAGFTSVSSLLNRLANMMRDDRSLPGRKIQSLEESSFDAWIKFWKNLPNDQNREVSFYDKGASVSLLLDLEIRQRTQNRASLDEVMRALYQRFPLSGPGFTSEDFQSVVEEIGAGDYDDFFNRYVRGTDELDFARSFGYAGLEVIETLPDSTRPYLGISTRENDGNLIIHAVIAGTAAYDAGVNSGDEIIALNGYRLRPNQLTARLSEFNPGDKIQLTLFRDEQLREFEVILRSATVPEYSLRRIDNPTDLQKEIYASWLGTPWPEVGK